MSRRLPSRPKSRITRKARIDLRDRARNPPTPLPMPSLSPGRGIQHIPRPAKRSPPPYRALSESRPHAARGPRPRCFRAALRAKDVGANTAFVAIVSAQVGLLAASWFSQGTFDYAPLAQFFWLFSGAVARSDAWA